MKILILISLFITTTLAQTEHDDAIILTLEHQNSIQLDSTLLMFFEENLTQIRANYDTLKTVHAFAPYSVNQLLLQTFASWAEPWKKGELLTGNDVIDSLSVLYGLKHAEGDDYGMFLLQYDQPLKIDKLALLYEAISGIIYASPNHSSGDGDRIEYFHKSGIDHFVFSKGWGDCPAGCIFRYYWYVEMKDSSARLLAQNPKDYYDSRFYTWNIPERFSMTHFNSADAIIDSIQLSERWWIQQHSIEGSWRFFIYDSPRYYVDENARWPSLQKSIKGQVHELLNVLEQVQYNSDPDVAASAVYAIQQIRSVTLLDELVLNPDQTALLGNYPNPFNPTTTIEYTVGANNHSSAYVTLKIYDILGREVRTLVNKNQPAGKYRVTFDASGLASGIYYYRIAIHLDRLDAGEYTQTGKMLLLR